MRVIVADDQRVVREGLVTLLGTLPGVEIVGAASDGAEALELAVREAPDVVLMDLRMPTMDGVEATRAIREARPESQVVVLTTYADDESIVSALQAGAIGYLTKDAARDDIARALDAAASGQAILDAQVQSRLLEALSSPARPPAAAGGELPGGLTTREAEVLGLIAEGLSNAEIAGRLYVSEATVKTHVNHVFAKTNSRDRAQAVAFAHRHGLAR